MIPRVPRAAVAELRAIAEHHLRAHGWSDGESLCEVLLYPPEIAALLLEALAYVREAHPWLGRGGAVVEPPAPYPPETQSTLADVLHALPEPFSLDAAVEALARALPFEISDAPAGRRRAAPRAYPFFPSDWPEALAGVTPIDRVFGILAEPGWIRDPARRTEALRAALSWHYEEIPLVELDAETAQRVAASLFAGPGDRGAFQAYRRQASAWVRLFGPETRAFANRDFDEDERGDPFAHVETYGWYTADSRGDSWCSGGKALALVVTDGWRAAVVDAIWETWSE